MQSSHLEISDAMYFIRVYVCIRQQIRDFIQNAKARKAVLPSSPPTSVVRTLASPRCQVLVRVCSTLPS